MDLKTEISRLKALCSRASEILDVFISNTTNPSTEALAVAYLLKQEAQGTVPFFEVWAINNGEGDINELFDRGMWGVGTIYGYDFNLIEQCLDDLKEYLRNTEIERPINCSQINYRVANLYYEPDEYEQGRCIARGGFAMDVKVIDYEVYSEEELEAMEEATNRILKDKPKTFAELLAMTKDSSNTTLNGPCGAYDHEDLG